MRRSWALFSLFSKCSLLSRKRDKRGSRRERETPLAFLNRNDVVAAVDDQLPPPPSL